jgi:RNA helicase HrpA
MTQHADDLPIWTLRDELVQLLRTEPVVVVEGATGCGKSTQIPRMLLQAGVAPAGRIGVTQPRRIACLSVSHKIAVDTGTEVGGLVGYKMRFADATCRDTRVKIMTDGILIQEMQLDRNLDEYDVLMIDEAHERSLNIDIILGLLKQILGRRRDLRVLVSSATIDPERFARYFDDAPILTVPHHPHPVATRHLPLDGAMIAELIDAAADEAARIVQSGKQGDILVFVTGEGDIKQFVQRLEPAVQGQATILPLYARLSREEQEAVFEPVKGTKIVVATNIAETSVTIDGIDWVIDTGRAKINAFNPRTLIQSLEEQPISQASAEQRRGRTGRTRPGTCLRLFSKEALQRRPRYTDPEILRSDLAEVVLRMLDLGLTDVEGFDFPTPPRREAIPATLERLHLLGAIDEHRRLTDLGRRMVRFPLDPRLARLVMEAQDRYPGVMREVLICAAFLSARQPFLLPLGEEDLAREAHDRFADPLGDFASYLRLFDAYEHARDKEAFCTRSYLDPRMLAELANVVTQLEEIVRSTGGEIRSGGPHEHVLRCLVAGLAENLCRRGKGREYETLHERQVMIHPGSYLRGSRPAFMVVGEIVRTSRTFARSCSPVHAEWIAEISAAHRERWLGRRHERAQRENLPLELPVKGSTVRLVPRGNKRVVVLDLPLLTRVAAETPRAAVVRLGRLRVDVRDQGVDLFHNEPLLDVVDFVRVVGPPPPPRKSKHLNLLLDPVDDLRLLERTAADLPLVATAGRNHHKAGVLALLVGENDVFWLDLLGNPVEAVSQSLESLRALVAILEDDRRVDVPAAIRDAEARLATILDRMVNVGA